MIRNPRFDLWVLDPEVVYLNHGSFGATPRPVLEEQNRLRMQMERSPVRFLYHQLEPLLDEARAALGSFLGADPDDLAFVPNATAGVNTVLRSLRLQPGDELLVTDQEYLSSRNALDFVAERSGAKVVVAEIPFPILRPRQVVEAVMAKVTNRTRLLLIDHVTSSTGMILPTPQIVTLLAARGIDTLVDGAHAPGMIPLDLEAIGAAYYTGNGHKWLCSPKGSAFLHVRKDRQDQLRPLAIGHGATNEREGRSRFRLEADWPGTHDPTPWLCIPKALEVMGSVLPGGWDELRNRNRNLVLQGRRTVCDALGIAPPCPDSMIGSIASLPLPDEAPTTPGRHHPLRDALHDALFAQERIEVPVFSWPGPPRRLLRISAQAYNEAAHYDRLGAALRRLLTTGGPDTASRTENGQANRLVLPPQGLNELHAR